jgi:hypothetical protein
VSDKQGTTISISPNSVIVDRSDLIYFSDGTSHSIRVIHKDGNMAYFAGNGAIGFSGDNGPATLARLHHPQGLAANLFGSIYLCDFGNNRVRMIDGNNMITSVVGNGSYDYLGDFGPATSASLRGPQDVTVDLSGVIYIADYGNHCIRMVNTHDIITTLVGSGLAGYSGNIYIYIHYISIHIHMYTYGYVFISLYIHILQVYT